MQIIYIILFVFILFTTPVLAGEDDIALPKGRRLSVKHLRESPESPFETHAVFLDGKVIFKGDSDILALEKLFNLKDRTVVLIADHCGGSACIEEYRFLTITSDNKVLVSKKFVAGGGIVKFDQTGEIITLTSRGDEAKQIYIEITYKNGQVNSKKIDNWTNKVGKILPVTAIFKMAGKNSYDILANLDVKATIMNALKISENIYTDFMFLIALSHDSIIKNSILVLSGYGPHSGGSNGGIIQIHISGDISMYFVDWNNSAFYYTNSSKYASSIDEVSANLYI